MCAPLAFRPWRDLDNYEFQSCPYAKLRSYKQCTPILLFGDQKLGEHRKREHIEVAVSSRAEIPLIYSRPFGTVAEDERTKVPCAYILQQQQQEDCCMHVHDCR